MKIIELNDSAIRVGDDSGIIVQSPGFALADGDSLLLGDSAEQQARLKPTSAYNKYWHELSLEPISISRKIRHFADIAYAHLLHLAEIGNIDSEVIFAVPGNFSREQLAILLGLAHQSPMQPVGVVDSALAATIGAIQSQSIVYIDMQLHQVVLTRLSASDQHVKTDSVIQIPGVGSQSFMDLMMQLATGLFIQQCRFNPEHNAESEQQLYNSLPQWLQQGEEDGNLILELNTTDAVHRAKMPRESLVNQLAGHYKKINEQIVALATDHDVQLLLSPRVASLPGFTNSLKNLPNFVVVDDHAVNSACLEYRELITGQEGGIHLIDSLPFANSHDATTIELEIDEEIPTHAVYDNRAYHVDKLEIRGKRELNGSAGLFNEIVISDPELPAQLAQLTRTPDGIYLDSGQLEVKLNAARVQGKHKLKLGDRICFGDHPREITLIRVNDV